VLGSSGLGGDFFEANFMILARVMVCWFRILRFGWPALFWGWVGRVALMESLILAQDERWRRA
jgi:hypothetical protein